MNDLESTAARSPHTAITALATHRLRSIGGSASVAATNGLVDAFAEVFARMAAAAPPSPPSQRSPETPVNSELSTDRDDRNEADSQSEATAVSDDANADGNDAQASIDPMVIAAAGPQQVVQPIARETPAADDAAAVPTAKTENATAATPQSSTRSQTSDAPTASDPSSLDAEVVTQRSTDSATTTDVDSGQPAVAADDVAPAAAAHQRSTGESETDAATGVRQGDGSEVDEAPRSSRRVSRRDRRDGDTSDDLNRQRGGQVRAEAASQELLISESAGESSLPPAPDAAGNADPSMSEHQSQNVANVESLVDATAGKTAIRNNRGGGSAIDGIGRTNQRTLPGTPEPPGSPREAAATKPQAEKGTGRSTAETISRIKLIQRVSKAFQHLGAEGGVVRLRLAPAELGSVRIEMRIQQRKVEARVVADTEAAGAALREHLPDLRARLESYGMQVEKIEVETETQQSQAQLGEDGQSGSDWDRQQQQPRGRHAPQRAIGTSSDVSRPVVPRPDPILTTAAGMDVRV